MGRGEMRRSCRIQALLQVNEMGDRYMRTSDILYEREWALITIVFWGRIDSSIDEVSSQSIAGFTPTNAEHQPGPRSINNLVQVQYNPERTSPPISLRGHAASASLNARGKRVSGWSWTLWRGSSGTAEATGSRNGGFLLQQATPRVNSRTLGLGDEVVVGGTDFDECLGRWLAERRT